MSATREPAPHSPAQGELSFEDSIQAVEEIIERIESGEIGLEKSIAEYERGMLLLNRCKDVLRKAEQRVEELGKQATPRPDAQ